MSTANAPRTQLGRYQLVRHLVSGGMAELWLAQSPAAQHVALRRVHAERARDPRFVQAFLDDMRVATTLRHPNIAAVHEVGHERGEYFVAVEWIHGADVRRILADVVAKERTLPLEHILTIALAATAGLQHAHARGIVHGDVTPASIVVGFDGHVKLVDFGLANAANRTRETQPGGMQGKVGYMSPEQCVGSRVDARSDIYALGIVLHELVTARRLFKTANDFLGMTAILHGELPRPSALRTGVPAELDAIIMTALARDPARRFQTVEEMRAALEQLGAAKHLRTSPALLADHLRKAFGKQSEPWLAAPVTVDFDGDAPGVVAIPTAALHQGPTATPANGDEATDIVAPLPLDLPLVTGDSTMIVRGAASRPRKRTHVAVLAILAAGALAAGAVVFYQRGGIEEDRRALPNPNIKLPPPSNPAPTALPIVSPSGPAPAAEPVVGAPAAAATPAVGEPSVGEKSVGEKSVGEKSVGEKSVGEKSVGEKSVGEKSVGEKSVGEKSVGESSVGERSVGEKSVSEKSVGEKSAIQKKTKKKRGKRPVRRIKKTVEPETAWDRDALFPK